MKKFILGIKLPEKSQIGHYLLVCTEGITAWLKMAYSYI